MAISTSIATDIGIVSICCTGVDDGDFALTSPSGHLAQNRALICDRPWTWLQQVHGNRVVLVSSPGQHAGADADGAVSNRNDVALSVLTADCAPLALIGTRGFAVVHAGWRGLLSGVVAEASDALSAIGSSPIRAVLGPCIHPSSYEFSAADLVPLVKEFGKTIVGQTTSGGMALDLPELVRRACDRASWPEPEAISEPKLTPGPGWPHSNGETPASGSRSVPTTLCTSNREFFSHRVRSDLGRQTMVGWIES